MHGHVHRGPPKPAVDATAEACVYLISGALVDQLLQFGVFGRLLVFRVLIVGCEHIFANLVRPRPAGCGNISLLRTREIVRNLVEGYIGRERLALTPRCGVTPSLAASIELTEFSEVRCPRFAMVAERCK